MTNLCFVYSYLTFSDDRTQKCNYFVNSTPDVTVVVTTRDYKLQSSRAMK